MIEAFTSSILQAEKLFETRYINFHEIRTKLIYGLGRPGMNVTTHHPYLLVLVKRASKTAVFRNGMLDYMFKYGKDTPHETLEILSKDIETCNVPTILELDKYRELKGITLSKVYGSTNREKF